MTDRDVLVEPLAESDRRPVTGGMRLAYLVGYRELSVELPEHADLRELGRADRLAGFPPRFPSTDKGAETTAELVAILAEWHAQHQLN